MNIKLLGSRVLIEIEKKEEKTASGLLLSKTPEMGEIMTGRVVAVGLRRNEKNTELVNCDIVALNDKVMFQYGTSVLYEGKSYLLVNEADVIMII